MTLEQYIAELNVLAYPEDAALWASTLALAARLAAKGRSPHAVAARRAKALEVLGLHSHLEGARLFVARHELNATNYATGFEVQP